MCVCVVVVHIIALAGFPFDENKEQTQWWRTRMSTHTHKHINCSAFIAVRNFRSYFIKEKKRGLECICSHVCSSVPQKRIPFITFYKMNFGILRQLPPAPSKTVDRVRGIEVLSGSLDNYMSVTCKSHFVVLVWNYIFGRIECASPTSVMTISVISRRFARNRKRAKRSKKKSWVHSVCKFFWLCRMLFVVHSNPSSRVITGRS